MKYTEQFYVNFAKYVEFKKEWWYVKDQLLKWTEKQFDKKEFKSRKHKIIEKLKDYDTPEVKYLIDVLENEDQESVYNFSEPIDSDYCNSRGIIILFHSLIDHFK